MRKPNLFLDMHVLQTAPPSCINRDDTGSPKIAIYGGTTRARVSSQAWKKAMRDMFRDEIFDENLLGSRTKRILEMVTEEMENLDPSIDPAKAKVLASEVLTSAGVKLKEEQTDALFFMSAAQAKEMAKIAVASKSYSATEKKNMKKECLQALKNSPSVDIALFGRMVASEPLLNCDAAAQVAHAISTHTIQNEYDYFTAVDDLSPEDNAGAGHLGTIEYNSATLYRYATVNLMELVESLGTKDTPKVARGFVEAFVRSMPTGKQNTFANRTLPDAVYVTIRRDQPVNLCGAFEKPVQAGNQGYATASAKELVKYANTVYTNYATEPVCAFAVGDLLGSLAESMPLNELLDRVAEKVSQFLSESEGE